MFRELEKIILARKEECSSDSYTQRLLTEGFLVERKVHEELFEVIEAAFTGKREALLYEAADLFYHLLVLLRKYDISLEEVAAELQRRQR